MQGYSLPNKVLRSPDSLGSDQPDSLGSDQRNILINRKFYINSSCFQILNAQFCAWNEGFNYQAIACQEPIDTICQEAFGTLVIRDA